MAVGVPTSTSATSADADGGASVNVDVDPPSGLTTGDVWLLVAILDHASSTIATPSGFTPVHAQINGNGGFPGIRSFWKAAGSSESAINVSASGTDNYVLYVPSIRITGANTTNPIGNAGTPTTPTGTGNTIDAPDVTIQNDGSAAILIAASVGTDGGGGTINYTQPAGASMLQERAGNNIYPAGGVAYELRNAGSYAPGNWTMGAVDGGRIGITFEILPAAGGGGVVVPVMRHHYMVMKRH